jgi:hypothetical protein
MSMCDMMDISTLFVWHSRAPEHNTRALLRLFQCHPSMLSRYIYRELGNIIQNSQKPQVPDHMLQLQPS